MTYAAPLAVSLSETLKLNVMSATALATGASFRYWMLALRMTSLTATSLHDEPSVDLVRVPEDSSAVIVIDTKALSPPSTSVYGKSETA